MTGITKFKDALEMLLSEKDDKESMESETYVILVMTGDGPIAVEYRLTANGDHQVLAALLRAGHNRIISDAMVLESGSTNGKPN